MDLKVDALEIRFFISLIFCLLFSNIKSKPTKRNAMLAFLIIYLAYGAKNMAYLIVSLILNIALINSGLSNKYTNTILNIANIYVYKCIAKIFEPRIGKTFDITGFLMMLTIKMGYLALHYDQNMENLLDYLLFIPGLLTGPVIPYNHFITLRKSDKHIFKPLFILKSLLYLFLHVFLRTFNFKSIILQDSSSLWQKLGSLYLFNLGGRMKFYFSWHFADVCFLAAGFPGYLNIDIKHVELCESVGEISKNWNKFVSSWTKELFFLPLKHKSMFWAVFISYMFSAALHGFNICYFIFFLCFALYSKPISNANHLIRWKSLRIIQMIFFVSYFSMPFYLLNIKELFEIWGQLYFFGHFYCTFWLIYFLIFAKNHNSEKTELNKNACKPQEMKIKNE